MKQDLVPSHTPLKAEGKTHKKDYTFAARSMDNNYKNFVPDSGQDIIGYCMN